MSIKVLLAGSEVPYLLINLIFFFCISKVIELNRFGLLSDYWFLFKKHRLMFLEEYWNKMSSGAELLVI